MDLEDELLAADDWDDGRSKPAWFIEPKDSDPRSEFARQVAFLNQIHKQAPGVDALAIPNARNATGWEHLQRWREGARGGALDLVLTWMPTRRDDRGVFFAEFKSGKTMPTRQQRDRLNMYCRQGHACGVYRQPETLIAHLRDAGAPFLSWEARA